MANNNLGGTERRKPGIQALPEERRRGVTIRFLPEMKNDIYDLRDWLEREGPKGKRLLSQILKYQGKIDELLAKIKGARKEEETGFPPLPNYEELKKDAEIKELKERIQQLELQQAELEELREQVSRLKNLFAPTAACRDGRGGHPNFACLLPDQARRLLKITQNPSNRTQGW